jgi:hypothetical protein
MKLTVSALRSLIKEEARRALYENETMPDLTARGGGGVLPQSVNSAIDRLAPGTSIEVRVTPSGGSFKPRAGEHQSLAGMDRAAYAGAPKYYRISSYRANSSGGEPLFYVQEGEKARGSRYPAYESFATLERSTAQIVKDFLGERGRVSLYTPRED